ncbi:MAG: NAD(P)/FAD-dependent oxidoreductase [Anaerolineae bacterium]|nr:NAD(P)/FAD-dependent oxidoreductase [Anaerolineae bacterium]
MKKADVLIIGGGPAGAACAKRLKQNDVSCIVLDKAVFPRFKPCAGWITPEVLQLADISLGQYPHSFTKFSSFDVSIRGFKIKLPTHQYSIRRYEFDQWFLKQANVEVNLHKVNEIRLEKDEYIVDGEYSGRYLIGAGGTNCPVYRTFFRNISPRTASALIVAQEEEFYYDVLDPKCKLWFLENKLPGYAWYVPKQNGFLNIGVGGAEEQLKRNGDSLKNHWNLLVNHLEESGLVADHKYKPVGHSYYLRQKLPAIHINNAFLVGDALGLATLDMGEGIGPAIQSGYLAAESIIHNSAYSIDSISCYSFPSLLGFRK